MQDKTHFTKENYYFYGLWAQLFELEDYCHTQ